MTGFVTPDGSGGEKGDVQASRRERGDAACRGGGLGDGALPGDMLQVVTSMLRGVTARTRALACPQPPLPPESHSAWAPVRGLSGGPPVLHMSFGGCGPGTCGVSHRLRPQEHVTLLAGVVWPCACSCPEIGARCSACRCPWVWLGGFHGRPPPSAPPNSPVLLLLVGRERFRGWFARGMGCEMLKPREQQSRVLASL